jgi:hypothetical protein
MALGAILLMICSGMPAQTTVSTGSIVGTLTDPQGAVISGARVTVTNVGTAQIVELTTNSAGSYNSGALAPGSYRVKASSPGFKSTTIPVTVQVGNTSTANAQLEVGQESQIVEVSASQVQVNTSQATVQGVVIAAPIDNLPINGRNFLDLAQLEPGVQIQDGQNFDPTKAGFSSISFGGRFGRTARTSCVHWEITGEIWTIWQNQATKCRRLSGNPGRQQMKGCRNHQIDCDQQATQGHSMQSLVGTILAPFALTGGFLLLRLFLHLLRLRGLCGIAKFD